MRLITILIGAVLMVGFQNCSQVDFAPADEEALVGKADFSSEEVADAEAEDDGSVADDDLAKDDDDVADDDTGKPSCKDKSDRKYICILDGAGKSVRLGSSDELLMENGRTVATVCMSKKACLDIVSQKFEVKSAEIRGFCPDRNPNVLSLSDEQVQAGIDEL